MPASRKSRFALKFVRYNNSELIVGRLLPDTAFALKVLILICSVQKIKTKPSVPADLPNPFPCKAQGTGRLLKYQSLINLDESNLKLYFQLVIFN